MRAGPSLVVRGAIIALLLGSCAGSPKKDPAKPLGPATEGTASPEETIVSSEPVHVGSGDSGAAPDLVPAPVLGEGEGEPEAPRAARSEGGKKELIFDEEVVSGELARPGAAGSGAARPGSSAPPEMAPSGGGRPGAKPARKDPADGSPAPAPPVAPRRSPPKAAGVKAGWADDNQQFNHFLGFLEKFQATPHLPLDVSSRIRFRNLDADGRSLPNCLLRFSSPKGEPLQERRSYADGSVLLFPSESSALQAQGLKLQAECLGEHKDLTVDVGGRREVDLRFAGKRPVAKRVPLDVAFLLDTTGSMGDEIERLRATLEAIHFQIAHLPSEPDVRFGMVLYRDKGDDYRTRTVPFTGDLDQFQAALNDVRAGGGGDTPEDLQEGLRETLLGLKWRSEGLRMVFVLADAPPHLNYGQDFTYVSAMQEAARRGIKIVTIGASGLPPQGELVFRQMAQYSQGIFVFLTYGEGGESEGGSSFSVSHHTGSNWQSRDLDAIVVQMVRRELSYLGDRPLADDEDEDYHETEGEVAPDQRAAALGELFAQGAAQLVKYSSLAIAERSPTAVLPVAVSDPSAKAQGEHIEDLLLLALSQQPSFQVVERRDSQRLVEELRRAGSDLFDPDRSAKLGEMVGAQLVLMSRLTPKRDRLELFVKLVRVQTGEVLSVTLLKIDPELLK